jgi:hypothetical protein
MPSGSPLFVFVSGLEVDTETELDPARAGQAVCRNQLGIDHTKIRRIRRIKGRIQEVWMVEDIEEVKREFRFDALGNRRAFPETRVQVPGAKATEGAVAAVIGI